MQLIRNYRHHFFRNSVFGRFRWKLEKTRNSFSERRTCSIYCFSDLSQTLNVKKFAWIVILIFERERKSDCTVFCWTFFVTLDDRIKVFSHSKIKSVVDPKKFEDKIVWNFYPRDICKFGWFREPSAIIWVMSFLVECGIWFLSIVIEL